MKPADKYQRELFSEHSEEPKMSSGSTENRLVRGSTGNSNASADGARLFASDLNSSEFLQFNEGKRSKFYVPKPSSELANEDHPLSDVQTNGYVLLDMPLEGAMGAVYRAWNISLERIVALKLSTVEVEAKDRAAKEKQLVAEAANLARIEHPSIATCYGYGKFEDISYFEMQWVDGVSVAQLIKFLFQGNFQNAIESDCIKAWMLSLVEALIYCQHRGIHHLDLKPRNLILSPKPDSLVEGNDYVSTAIENLDFKSVSEFEIRKWCRNQEIKVLDFGVACRSQEDGVISTLSGTPAWMSPEQVCGVPVDPIYIDQYGIGGVFYACLTGRSPNDSDINAFKSARQDSAPKRFCHRPAPSELNRDVDADLEAIVMKCLSDNPEQRYSSFDQLRNDIEASRSLRPIKARTLGTTERAARYVRRHPWAVLSFAVLVSGLSVLSLLAVSLLKANGEAATARQRDKATFEQAVNSVATMDRLVMSDPKLNQIENRDLSARFKATLFELYRLLSEREGLEVSERRRLASVSQRLAKEQQKRGDYQLAASFHKTTAQQYRSVMQDDEATDADIVAWCFASIDQMKAESLVSRRIHSSKSILARAKSLASAEEIIHSKELSLYALANQCRLRYELEGREAARHSGDLLNQVEALAVIARTDEPWQKLLKARSLYNLGLVRYKGAISGFADSYQQSLELYREMMVDSPGDNELVIEYASTLNTVTMAAVNLLKKEFAAKMSGDSSAERQESMDRLIRNIDRDYSTAAHLIQTRRNDDPLNNELLQHLISSQWMVADFYRLRSEVDPTYRLEYELEMRDACMSSIKLMKERQPFSAKVNHDLALHLFRQSCCYRNLDDEVESINCIEQIVEIEDWWQLKSFEVSDTVRFVLRILEQTSNVGEELLVEPEQFKVVLGKAIEMLERYRQVYGEPLEMESLDIPASVAVSFTMAYKDCKTEIETFFRLTQFGVHENEQLLRTQASAIRQKQLDQDSAIVDVPLDQ